MRCIHVTSSSYIAFGIDIRMVQRQKGSKRGAAIERLSCDDVLCSRIVELGLGTDADGGQRSEEKD